MNNQNIHPGVNKMMADSADNAKRRIAKTKDEKMKKKHHKQKRKERVMTLK